METIYGLGGITMSLIDNFDCNGCSGDFLCEDHFQQIVIQQAWNLPVITSSTYKDPLDDQHLFWEPARSDMP